MQETPKIIVFGKNGFLGSHLFRFYQNQENTYFGYKSKENTLVVLQRDKPRIELPWTNEALLSIVHELQPDVIINAIALINTEQCEANPLLAEHTNAEIPAVLASAASHVGARIVQISTDAVFGQQGSNFTEEDAPHPISIYGKTKLQGERSVIELAPKSLILRTNFYGHHQYKQTLFDYFYKNLLLGHSVKGYNDVVFNPVYIKDLVLGIQKFIEVGVQGILHFVGDEVLSKYEFGNKISQHMDHHNGRLTRQNIGDLEPTAHRKLDLTLSSKTRKSIYQSVFDIDLGIRDAILNAKVDKSEL
jgi:dTDP-4-dehydrorhamnose reductase